MEDRGDWRTGGLGREDRVGGGRGGEGNGSRGGGQGRGSGDNTTHELILCSSRPYDKRVCRLIGNCMICPLIITVNKDCSVKNIVYKIDCLICLEFYLGETERTALMIDWASTFGMPGILTLPQTKRKR